MFERIREELAKKEKVKQDFNLIHEEVEEFDFEERLIAGEEDLKDIRLTESLENTLFINTSI